MFAVIKTGGKQYKVAADDVVTIEKLAGEAGDTISFGEVLMTGDGDNVTLGAPFVSGATVAGEVVEQGRGPKLIVFKKRRRQNSRRRNGHRQDVTIVRITDILTDGKKPAARKAKAESAPAEDKVEAKAAADETKAKAAPKSEAKAEAKTEAKKAEPKKAAAKPADTAKSDKS